MQEKIDSAEALSILFVILSKPKEEFYQKA